MKKSALGVGLAVLLVSLPGEARGDEEAARRQIANRIGKIETLLALLEEKPDDVPTRLEVARACLELSELGCAEALGEHVVDLARDQVWEILKAHPDHEVARQLAILLENHSLVLPSDAVLGTADEAYREGRYEDAIRLGHEVRNRGDGSAALDLLIGVSHLLVWEIEDARFYVGASLEKDPFGALALRYRGKCAERGGNLDAALADYVAALVEDPSLDGAWQDLSWVARHQGQRVRRFVVARVADLREGADGKLSIVVSREEKDARTNSWLGHAAIRAKWRKTEYAVRFGNGTAYRRTWFEEKEAWGKMIEIWKSLRGPEGASDPDLDRLSALDDQGLLGAFAYVECFAPSFPALLDVQGGIERNRVERYLREVVLVPEGK